MNNRQGDRRTVPTEGRHGNSQDDGKIAHNHTEDLGNGIFAAVKEFADRSSCRFVIVTHSLARHVTSPLRYR